MSTPHDFSDRESQYRNLSGPMSGASRRTSSRGGCLRSLVPSIGVLILGAAFLIGFDNLIAPWAWDWFGRPTLVGEWVGEFRLPAGQRGAAYLNLDHDRNGDFGGFLLGRNLPPLSGTARDCFSASRIQTYALSGGASARGDDVELGFKAQKPTVPGYALQSLKGTWEGSRLRLSGTFTKILDTQDSTEVANEANQTQPTTLVLTKASQADFEKACQALGQ